MVAPGADYDNDGYLDLFVRPAGFVTQKRKNPFTT